MFIIIMNIYVISSIYCLISFFNIKNINNIAETYYSDRINKKKKHHKVYDIGHKYLPDMKQYCYISELFILLTFMSLFFYRHIFPEFASLFLTVLIFRDIFINLTILPKDKDCDINNIYSIGSCYDKIFSGHFSILLLLTLLYHKYNIIEFKTLVFLNLINALIIIMVRYHYTVDVIVAFFVTLFIYQNNLRIK